MSGFIQLTGDLSKIGQIPRPNNGLPTDRQGQIYAYNTWHVTKKNLQAKVIRTKNMFNIFSGQILVYFFHRSKT